MRVSLHNIHSSHVLRLPVRQVWMRLCGEGSILPHVRLASPDSLRQPTTDSPTPPPRRAHAVRFTVAIPDRSARPFAFDHQTPTRQRELRELQRLTRCLSSR